MSINLERNAYLFVAEPFRHHLDRNPCFQHQGGSRMTEPMDRNRPDLRRLHEFGEFPLPEVIG